MDESQLSEGLEEMFDNELLHHGFMNYMRDYELVVYQSVDPDPRYGLVPRHLRFIFRMCTVAEIRSTVRPDVWTKSLDDSLVDLHSVTVDSPGYVWGVQSQILYPGARIVEGSGRARHWKDEMGIEFHEVLIEGNAHAITLVFSDLVTDEVSQGYSPFQVGIPGHGERHADTTKIPLRPDDSSGV